MIDNFQAKQIVKAILEDDFDISDVDIDTVDYEGVLIDFLIKRGFEFSNSSIPTFYKSYGEPLYKGVSIYRMGRDTDQWIFRVFDDNSVSSNRMISKCLGNTSEILDKVKKWIDRYVKGKSHTAGN